MPTFPGQTEAFPVHAPAVVAVGTPTIVFSSFVPPSDAGDTLVYGAVIRKPSGALEDLSPAFDFALPSIPFTPTMKMYQFTPVEVGDYMIVCYAANQTAPNELDAFGVTVIQSAQWAANMDAKMSNIKKMLTEVSRVRTLIKRT